jgi:hypothetical protein
MRTITIAILIFSFTNLKAIELIPNSDKQLIDSIVLIGKSKEFLRYARNEIFARHGYVFSDSCLSNYFKHQDWYEAVGKNVSISEIEQKNLELIKKYEANFEYADSKIIMKVNLNGFPIYYLGQDWDNLNFHWQTKKNYKFWTGFFHCLSKENLWALHCESIPPEAIKKLSEVSFEIADEGELHPEQIKVIDFNKNCQDKIEKEIQVNIYGPSNDPELYVLGLRNNKFQILFHENGDLNRYKCHSKTEIEIDMTIRHDIAGTMFRQQSYFLDLETGKVTEPCVEILEFNVCTSTLKRIKFYKTKEGASKKDANDQLGKLKKGISLTFSKYYQGMTPGAIYFESDTEKGWINYDLINYDHFALSVAD